MNPPNLFGKTQGSAFQAPSRSTGVFQSFGQQGTGGTPQNVGFGQTATFGQTSAFSQPVGFGQNSGQTSTFGQTPAFGQTANLAQSSVFGSATGLGQTSGTSSAFAQNSAFVPGPVNPPAFGQSAMGQGNSSFTSLPSYAQATGQTPSSLFGQAPAFGQTSAFVQPTNFAPQTSVFGLPSVGSTPASQSSQATGFSQPPSGQASAFSLLNQATTSAASGSTQGIVQSQGFRTSEFSFKPSDAAVFKPIFSVSPEPSSSQPSRGPEVFGSGQPTVASMESGGPNNSTPSALDFCFSQPAAAPSIAFPSAGLPQTDAPPTTSGASSKLEFTFSQPAAPSNSGSAPQPAPVPSSPSSFSFVPEVVHPTAAPAIGVRGFGQVSAFEELKAKPEAASKGGDETSSVELAFVSLGKGTKRKEESGQWESQGKSGKVEEPTTSSETTRHAVKRPLTRSLPAAGGLFRNVMSNLMKSVANPVKKESRKEEEPPPEWEEGQRPDPKLFGAPPPLTPPRAPAPSRDFTEKPGETAAAADPVPLGKRSRRTDSTDSLGGMSPSDATSVQCKSIPANLNTKDVLHAHFSRFGRVRQVLCRPNRSLAIIHFNDHASAAKAKKKGKSLRGHEILIFWQRKKISPEGKGEGHHEKKEESRERADARGGGFHPPGGRKPLPRPPAIGASGSLTKGSPVKKPSIAKALQFDTEPQLEPRMEGQSPERPTDSSLPSSLLHLVGQVCENAEEKYRLLEQRDKILRQGRPKRTDLVLSKVFVGTCPDMCPEKERYMRETRNQLSSYEVIPNTEKVDHTAAVKEYSRSSADQEEPLPHELRPLPVLSMTMDYLVTQIMDQGEENYRDWYDFVWNRTRGIRKDITQQHLCDPLTVSLIEKCTRFHIHCAHHLCQEPMMSFDAKINNENMTKCLQSLKEMYQDLATREIYCPCEAEFRQYNVLLKLNDGDMLREVQQFRSEVRNSPEVHFAVQAFAALNNNNFVRFFRLVRAASYLSGCILHRYFNQVRRDALRALNVAYTVAQRSTLFPVDDLVRMLMFRSAGEASDFIQQYGLNVCEGMVELNRTAFQDPDLPVPVRRSSDIMGKRAVLIGEVVNGGPLPNPSRHTPVCSFDSRNKYRGDGLIADPAPKGALQGAVPQKPAVAPQVAELRPLMDIEVRPPSKPRPLEPPSRADPIERKEQVVTSDPQQSFTPICLPQPIPPSQPPPKPEPVYTEQDITAEVESVVEEVLGTECSELACSVTQYISTALSVCDSQVEALVSEVTEQMLGEVCTSEIRAEKERAAEEKRRLEEARRNQEKQAFVAQFSEALCDEISLEVLTQCIKETAESEHRSAQEEEAACVSRSSSEVCCSLVEEALLDEIAQVAQEVLDLELKRIHKFLKRWRDVVAVRRQLKRQMRAFPAAPCCVDPRFKLKALLPSAPSSPCPEQLARGVVDLGNSGHMTISSTRLLKVRQETILQMRVHHYYRLLVNESVWTPLDLPRLVVENISQLSDRIFWKAALLLPSDQETEANVASRILTDWLEAKFSGEEGSCDLAAGRGGKMETLSICNELLSFQERTFKAHTCVKVTRGPLSEEGQALLEKQKALQGTSALLLLLPALLGSVEESPEEREEQEEVFLLSALLQLRQLQEASAGMPAVPLVVLVPERSDRPISDQKLEGDLMLPELVEDGVISEFVFVHIPETTSDLQGSAQVSQAVKWLAARAPAAVSLCSESLVQFLEGALCREFGSRLHQDKQDRAAAALPSQEPSPIIQLYNSVLLFLSDLLSCSSLSSLSWPMAEFCLPEHRDLLPQLGWNSPEHLAWLQTAVLSLQIPEWDLPAPTAPWPELCASIFQYASQIPLSLQSQPLLMSQLENLLGRTLARYQQVAPPTLGASNGEAGRVNVGLSFHQVPWDEILVLCIDHRLKDWRPPESVLSEDAITQDGEILVYFQKDRLTEFSPPSGWTEAVAQTHRDKQLEAEERSTPVPERNPSRTLGSPRLRQKLFHSPRRSPPPLASLDITHTPSPRELLPERVLSQLEQEKRQSQRFEEQLQGWLERDPLDSFSMPAFMPSSLISVPEIMTPAAKASATGGVRLSLKRGLDAPLEGSFLKSRAVSVSQRLKDLRRLISVNQSEELACGLHLNSLLEIVED